MVTKNLLGVIFLILAVFTNQSEQRECFSKGECK